MMTRRPFVSLLVVASLGVALALALLAAALSPLVQAALRHCLEANIVCHYLLATVRTVGTPILLLLLCAQLGWSGLRGLREGRRQWRTTRAALDYLGSPGRETPTGLLAALCAELKITNRVEVVTNSTRIWISSGALAVLGPAELRAVLHHERAHQRRRDPLQLLVARSCAAALPHLPVLRELTLVLPLAQELAADRAVMRDGARAALGRALLTLVDTGGEVTTPLLATGMITCLDARIDQHTGARVLLPHLSPGALARTGLTLGVGLTLFIALLVTAPPGAPPLTTASHSHHGAGAGSVGRVI